MSAGAVGGCAQLLMALVTVLLLQGVFFAIVRESAAGGNELAEWPDFFAVGDRSREIGGCRLIGLAAAAPSALVLYLLECVAAARLAALCWLASGTATVLGLACLVPAAGAVGVSRDSWLWLRLDLHRAAVRAAPALLGRTLLAVSLLVFSGLGIAATLLLWLPMIGVLAAVLVCLYAWCTSAHVIGLWRRRARGPESAIYER